MPTDTGTDPAPADPGSEPALAGTVTDGPDDPTSPSEPGSQLIGERIDDLTNAASPATPLAEGIAKSVADLVSDLLESPSDTIADAIGKTAQAVAEAVNSVLDALLGGGGVPGPVKDALESVGHTVANLASNVVQALGSVLGKLLGGGGAPIDDAIERVGGVVAALASGVAQALGGALDALLGGGGPAPATAGNPLVQPLATPPYLWQTNEITRRAAGVAAGIARATDRALDEAGSSAPPAAPMPLVPIAPPGGGAPAGYSYFLSSASAGASTNASQHLFVVLVALLAVFMQGGRLSWHRREPHRPHSALRLAVERPG